MCGRLCIHEQRQQQYIQVRDSLFTAAVIEAEAAVGYFMNNKWESITINHSLTHSLLLLLLL